MESLIQQHLESLAPEYRSFVEGEFIEVCAQTFSETLGFNERQIEVLENAFFFHLILLLNEARTIEFISKNCILPENDAAQLFFAFIANLPEPLPKQLKEIFTTLETNETTGLAAEIAQTETAYKNLQNTTTQTYQSSQFELLTKQPLTPQVNTPPTTGNTFTAPRWDSDTNGSR